MNSALSSTPSIASRIRGRSGSYCAFTSTSGIGRTASKSRGTYPSIDPENEEEEDGEDDEVLDVAEVVVEALIAGSRGPADAGESEGPDRRADRRQDDVPPEGHLEHPRRDRDERANDRRDAADQHREVVPAVEPALGAFEVLGRQVEPAPVALEQRAAAVATDRPADDRAGEVAERPRERHHDVRPEVGRDRRPEQNDVLAGECARSESPRVHHDE